MVLAIILTDCLLIAGIAFLVYWLHKKRAEKIKVTVRIKPNMEVFRGSSERLERSKRERLGRESMPINNIFLEGFFQGADSIDEINSCVRNDDNNLMRDRLKNDTKSEVQLFDLAEKSASSFEHGGLNMSSNSTNYFNI